MANKLEVLDSSFVTALKAKLICRDCKRNPRPNIPLYICQICQTYKCETCRKIRSGCTPLGHATYLEPTLTMITSTFKNHLCIMSKNGCGEEQDVKKLEDHEKYCPFQNVPCPVISCFQSVVFKDTQKHLDETHKCLKVDDEWEFEGTQEELVQNVCCLSSYGQQFFVQFQMYEKKCKCNWSCAHTLDKKTTYCRHGIYNHESCSTCKTLQFPDVGTCKNSIKENLLFLRIVMLGHQDEVHSFKAIMTYFHENGKNFAVEVDVLSITSGKEEFDSFTAIPMKKLTNYYDVKAGDFKTQPIKFTLKITNEKLDEIAKDKNTHIESGLEDSDPDE